MGVTLFRVVCCDTTFYQGEDAALALRHMGSLSKHHTPQMFTADLEWLPLSVEEAKALA